MTKRLSHVRDFVYNFCSDSERENCLNELFSPNLMYRMITGKRVGNHVCLSDFNDWFRAFPDWSVKLVETEEYENTVVATVEAQGTHLGQFEDTTEEEGVVLSTSEFLYDFPKMNPTKKVVKCRLETIYVFGGDQIERFSVYADEVSFAHQLGLKPVLPPSTEYLDLCEEKSCLFKHLKETLVCNLSERELECLILAVCGFGSKYTAEILGLSYRTVEAHLHACYQKTGCFGKQDCLELFIARGLLAVLHELCRILLKLKDLTKCG
ncbi:ester cyclase [Simkania negevensis]|nr:ester cyclase [Simkania negevensis]